MSEVPHMAGSVVDVERIQSSGNAWATNEHSIAIASLAVMGARKCLMIK